MSARLAVSIVSYNSAEYLAGCLTSLQAQTFKDLEIHLWDNASTDGTLEIAAAYADLLATSRFSNSNLGFSAGHNRIIGDTSAEYVLLLNPDVILEPRFLEILVAAMDRHTEAGAGTGKLWRIEPSAISRELSAITNRQPLSAEEGIADGCGLKAESSGRVIDTTGMWFTRNQRHLDRGSGEIDSGQYESRQYVFGASGAAALYRRSMLEELRMGREYFDEAFFAYREDADLAWRAQWLGWKCLYIPEATGHHVRRVLPERRALLPADINMHSWKNRFLMRVKNMDAASYLRFFVPITVRDLLALGYVLLRERSSLRAIPLFWRAFPGAWQARRALRRHRRASPRDMRRWFGRRPAAFPME